MSHAYWGPQYTFSEIEQTIRRCGLNYQVLDEDTLTQAVAQLLVDFKSIGWFQGRSEIGPRALGARSLIGNPMCRETLIRLNTIKSREIWRPLAPSVLQSRMSEFFEGTHASPFMIVASQVRPDMRNLIPAVVHVDGSARPQAVTRESNYLFWKLIRAFESRTGIPMIVNTSFNTQGEPLVNSPEDAIKVYLRTDLDALALGNVLLKKNG
jgi:carbamoyltransferase